MANYPNITISVGDGEFEYLVTEVVYRPTGSVLGPSLSLITPEGDQLFFDGSVARTLAQHYCKGINQ